MKASAAAAGLLLAGVSFALADERAAVLRVGEFSLEADKLQATVEAAQPSILIAAGFVEGNELSPDARADRIGVGIDLYLDDVRCAMARDIRSGIRSGFFDDTFGATATCIKRLDVGKHMLEARRFSPGVRNARITLTWSVSREEEKPVAR